jgi:thiol-disulfide isomerase/thioredoxin
MRPRLTSSTVIVLLMLATVASSTFGQQGSVTPAPSPERQPLTTLPNSVLEAELRSARGHSFKLSDYSGNVLVVNLWATWLGPSQFEVPELVKLQKQFRSKGVRVIGVSTENPDTSNKSVQDFIRKYRVVYRIGWATPEISLTDARS